MADNSEKMKSAVFAPRETTPLKPAAAPRAVRSQRKLLILGAILVLSSIVVIIWSSFINDDNTIEISVQSVSTTKTSGIEMTGAKYAGTTSTGKRYVITADKASETQAGGNEIKLIAPDGTLQDEEDRQMKMSAKEAVYISTQDQINMRGNVVIYQSENDLTLRTEYAEAYIAKGDFHAPQYVVLNSPSLHVTSQTMTARNNGTYFLFTGQTKLIVNPSSTSKTAETNSQLTQ